MTRAKGFEPFYDENSEVLILGSFPSVKSREQQFYYGNPRNAFWRILSDFFGVPEPVTVAEKKDFLTERRIALWDVVTECEIVGSLDADIKNYTVADLNFLLKNTRVGYIILNGGFAAKIFEKRYGGTGVPYIALPSTSPANARRNDGEWYDALRRIFKRT